MSSNLSNSILTPIKIPGKRQRKPPAGSEPLKKRRPGRPRKEEMKRRKIMAAEQTQPEHRSLENLKSERQRSTLENLPTEVLQNIFLHSMNYNLPRASPVLAGRLSSNYIYIKTITNVLKNQWKASLTEKIDDNWDPGDDHENQTELLKLRWVTPTLLMEARKRWFTGIFPSIEPRTIARRYGIQKADFLTRHPEYKDSEDWPETLETALYFEDDLFNRYHSLAVQQARPHDDNGEPQLCRGLRLESMEAGDMNIAARPPESVLRGPWTYDKLLYLSWITWAGPSLIFANHTVLPEVADQGLQDAIQEGSLEAISFLVRVGMKHFDHEAAFKALATTTAKKRAILIVRVLDLFLCTCQGSAPKGTWEYWVEDIIKMYGDEQNMPERRQLMKALKAEVYDYARRAYEGLTAEGYLRWDNENTERLKAMLAKTKIDNQL